MAITTSITKPLDSEHVQVDAANKYGYKRFFKVPRKNAKNFAYELRQQDKNLNLYSNITFFAAIFTGVFGAARFTKKMENKLKQFLIESATGIVFATLASIGFNKYAQSEEDKLKSRYKAKEIFYRA